MIIKDFKNGDSKYTVVFEGVLQSWLIDLGTFSSITLAFWFNHVFIGSKFLHLLHLLRTYHNINYKSY